MQDLIPTLTGIYIYKEINKFLGSRNRNKCKETSGKLANYNITYCPLYKLHWLLYMFAFVHANTIPAGYSMNRPKINPVCLLKWVVSYFTATYVAILQLVSLLFIAVPTPLLNFWIFICYFSLYNRTSFIWIKT